MKKKLLIAASSFGHLISFHLPYIRGFHELGWEVHVACGGDVKEIPGADESFTLPLEKSMTSPANFRAAAQVNRLCRKNRYDLVITHTSLAAFFTRFGLFALPHRPRVINVVHGYLFDERDSARRRAVMAAAERLVSGKTDLVLTMNRYDYLWAQKNRVASAVRHIPGMGVVFPPEESGRRMDWGLGEEDFVLVFPAEFSERKNQSMLIRALPLLPERVKLLLPGQGALREECRALSQQLGVAHRVLLPGFVTGIHRLLGLCDVAVSSSRYEGLPFNVMEAMGCSLPAVVSDVKGNQDLVEDGVNGYLFPYDDADAFAASVQKLLDDPGLCREMGARALEKIDAYRLQNVYPQVMREYLSVLE